MAVLDLGRPGGRFTRDTWWLNVYVMMSRPTCLKNCLFVNLPTRDELFDAGPPADLGRVVKQQEARAEATAARVEALMEAHGYGAL